MNSSSGFSASPAVTSFHGIVQNFATALSETYTLTKLRRHFYLVTPQETIFPDVASVPNYVDQALPYFLAFIAIEFIVLFLGDDEERKPRLNDTLTSMSCGILTISCKLLLRGLDVAIQLWVYQNYRLFTLPSTPLVWVAALLMADLCYYCFSKKLIGKKKFSIKLGFHRSAHMINIMWQAHHVHHSSEELTMATALRQGATQQFTSYLFYVPLALIGVPIPIQMVHSQFNLLFQFWIHTSVIKSLGPLEYFINSPAQHRVHHSRNEFAVNKNFAGVLVIWDRIFKTYEPERPHEKLYFGTPHPWKQIGTFNAVVVIATPWLAFWRRFFSIPKWSGRIRYAFAQPERAAPVTPNAVKVVHNNSHDQLKAVNIDIVKYDPKIHWIWKIYVVSHFLRANLLFISLPKMQPVQQQFIIVGFLFWTLSNMGMIFDRSRYARVSELLRLVLWVLLIEPALSLGTAGAVAVLSAALLIVVPL